MAKNRAPEVTWRPSRRGRHFDLEKVRCLSYRLYAWVSQNSTQKSTLNSAPRNAYSTSCPPPKPPVNPGSRDLGRDRGSRFAARRCAVPHAHGVTQRAGLSFSVECDHFFSFCRAPRAPTFRELFAPRSATIRTVTGVFSSYNQVASLWPVASL